MFELLFHIGFYHVHGHMTRAFNHHLYIVFPGDLGEFTQGTQFGKLGCVVGIGNGAGTQAIPQRECHVIGFHDLADVLKVGIEETLLVMGQTPFGHDGTAPGDNTGHAPGRQRNERQADTGMDGEIIHPLFGLFNEGVAENFPGQFLGFAVDLFQSLINGHRPDGNR